MSEIQNIPVQPIILCGGSGSRLWPLSRAGFPKQFLCLTGNESLFQLAAKRLTSLQKSVPSLPIIVTNEEHRFLVAEQLREIAIHEGTLLLEPEGRNTAPALTLAAMAAMEKGNDPVLLVIPADQTISDQTIFASAMQTAINEAIKGAIVILGITPDRAETGYGYIKTIDADTPNAAIPPVLDVIGFVEKPDLTTAQRYLEDRCYYWNAGMFVLRASVWLAALERFRPDIAATSRASWEKRSVDVNGSVHFVRPSTVEFNAIPAESVDYAVMEHCPGTDLSMKMVPLNAGWNDLGAWEAVWQASPKDSAGNAHSGDVLTIDSSDTLVHATNRLVSLVGVSNLVIIETPDAVLIADKQRSQDVKSIVAMLDASGRAEHSIHRKVHRPWGWYDNIDDGNRFKVKRIQVKPKASLSLQKHHHRAEHWIVVTGTAEITCGEKTLLLTENQSTYIPLGVTHRLFNPGSIPLEIIEVQSGSYLGEDDIVRYEDTYGRTTQDQ